MLSNTSRYAIRALIYLVVHYKKNEKIGIKIIAKELDIPSPFLGKILQILAKKKILYSTKGPNGGFYASEETRKTKLIDIIKIIDGDDLFDKCLISNKSCKDVKGNSKCSIHDHYQSIRNDITRMFSDFTIGRLADEYKNSEIKMVL